MRVVRTLLLAATVLTTCLFALASQDGAKKYDYQVLDALNDMILFQANVSFNLERCSSATEDRHQ